MLKTNEFLKDGQTIKSVIDISRLTAKEGSLPKRIKVLPVGEWLTLPYGPMAIDDGICTQMVANYKSDVRKAVPIDVDHDGGKAAGWINDLEAVKGDGVYAIVEWTKLGKELLTEKIYRLFSPEWSFDYTDPEKSTHHGAVLIAGSLTNRPLFKELPLLVASDGTGHKVDIKKSNLVLLLNSEDNKIMNIEEILKKAVADRTAEEVEFLKSAELNDEQKAQVEAENKPVETDEEKAARELKEKEEADAAKTPEELEVERQKELAEAKAKAEAEKTPEQIEAEKVEAEKAEAAKIASDNVDVTIKASELNAMKEKLATLEASEKKLIVEKEVATLVASENGGKLLPAQKDSVVNFILTCNDTQKASFLEIVKSLPELKIAGQKSAEDKGNMTAKDQIDKLVEDMVKASVGKLNVADATKSVLSKNSDLAKQYQNELSL